jgi:hypothetical protein
MSQVQVPRIWVPHMDSIALSNVDVNILPSQEPMGQDLPLNGKNNSCLLPKVNQVKIIHVFCGR